MTDRYINIFTDFGFKKVFGEEVNKDLLIDFLNELLKGEQTIKELVYKKTEHLGLSDVDRKAIFDLYCENEKGEKFIIEIQKTKQKFFRDRSLYYSTFPIAEQAEQGDWNFELKAVYTIAILDFVFDDEDRDKTVVSHVQLMDTKKKRVFNPKLTFVYLQMPNFTMTEEALETRFDMWLYILKNIHKLHDRPRKLQEKIFEKFFRTAEIALFNPMERVAYEDSLKSYRDLKNSLDTSREEGVIEGEMKGRIEGKIERNYEIAQALISAGDDNEKIALVTGLPIDEIVKVRKNAVEQ
jgi:predicted transposase/invertase (TIGR01784 family)